MTVQQTRLISALKTSKTLSEAGIKAGYSPKARSIYRKHTKKHIVNTLKCNPQSIIENFENLYSRCYEEKDYSTAKSIMDSLCRINAMFKDKHEVNVIQSLPPEKITVELIEEAKKALEDKSCNV